jgi:SAM-dependent methyltransferase
VDADFAGWNSSYTGEPIPPEEMLEWVEETVARIAAFEPQRILEIGCGTGLLLLRLARGRAEVLGTDFSSAALERLRSHLQALDGGLERMRLEQRAADDFTGIGERMADAVVLNSIAQYFPDAEYLRRVVEGAVAATRDGGLVFVGDVRDLSLARAFHASVALRRADPATPLAEVAARARERLEREPELLIDPVFFARLPERLPRLGGVEIRPKAGRRVNELSTYRYDVFLHVGAAPDGEPAISWRESGGEEWTEAGLRAELGAAGPHEALGVRGIRDPRLERDLAALDHLDRPAPSGTVADLASELAHLPRGELAPARLRAIAPPGRDRRRRGATTPSSIAGRGRPGRARPGSAPRPTLRPRRSPTLPSPGRP